MLRCPGLASFVMVLTLAGLLRAQPSDTTEAADVAASPPAPLRGEHLALALEVDQAVQNCPSLAEFSAWVDQLVGRPFIRPDAEVRLRVTVRPLAGGELVAEVLQATAPPSPRPERLRELRDRLDCQELMRAVALNVSLLAKPVSAEPVAPAAGVREGSGPAPNGAMQSPSASPSDPQEEPAAPPAPPAPNATPASEPPAPPLLAAGKIVAASPGAWSISGFAIAAAGQNPGGGLGAGLSARLRFESWSALAGGAYLASTGIQTQVAERSVRAEGPTAEVLAAGCWHSPEERWIPCLQLGYWWMFARGYRFDHNHDVVVRTAAVGAQLGGVWKTGTSWQLVGRVEVFVPSRPVRLEAAGETAPLWSMWPVVPRAAISVEWH